MRIIYLSPHLESHGIIIIIARARALIGAYHNSGQIHAVANPFVVLLLLLAQSMNLSGAQQQRERMTCAR